MRKRRPTQAQERRPRHELEWLTELWQLEPSFEQVQRIYRGVRASLPWRASLRSHDSDPTLAMQPYLRKVSAEFGRRLAAAGIFVEGDNP